MYGKVLLLMMGTVLTTAPAMAEETGKAGQSIRPDFALEFALGVEDGPTMTLGEKGRRWERNSPVRRWQEDDRLREDLEVSPFAGIRLRWRY